MGPDWVSGGTMATKNDRASTGGGIETNGRTGGLTREVAFETLSSRRRRAVMHYLLREDRPVTLKELSKQIAAWENETVPDAVTYDERMRVYTALRQCHLPMMAAKDVIRFDEDRGVAELTPEASDLEVYLDIVPHDSIPWNRYYAGLGILSLAFTSANWVGLFPFAVLSGTACAGIISLLLTGSALVHVYHDRKMRIGLDGEPPEHRGETEW